MCRVALHSTHGMAGPIHDHRLPRDGWRRRARQPTHGAFEFGLAPTGEAHEDAPRPVELQKLRERRQRAAVFVLARAHGQPGACWDRRVN